MHGHLNVKFLNLIQANVSLLICLSHILELHNTFPTLFVATYAHN